MPQSMPSSASASAVAAIANIANGRRPALKSKTLRDRTRASIGINGLNQRADVPECERKRLPSSFVAVDLRNMVGHQHARIPNLFIGPNRREHIDIAIIGERLVEVQETTANIAE